MKKDYILIAVDPHSKFAIRFASLEHSIKKSLKLHKPGKKLEKNLAQFLIGSVILGSRSDEQESTLYKLKFSHCPISINCEVSPRGPFRSAIFPYQQRNKYFDDPKGEMRVIRLKKENEMYESVIKIKNGNIPDTFRSYLISSAQRKSVFYINADVKDFKHNYGLWIEKLPDTDIKEWNHYKQRFSKRDIFAESFKNTNDPDKIIRHLFPDTIRILMVTKPRVACTCSKERIINALNILAHEDLVDIFMGGKGIETQCDYCHKAWKISDNDIKKLLKTSDTVH